MRRVLRVLGIGAVIACSPALLLLIWLSLVWPPPSWWRDHWPAETAFQRMRERQYAWAGETSPRRYRPVPLDSMSDWIPRAATAAEDDGFYQHRGVDYRAVREALDYRRPSFSWQNRRDRAEMLRAALGVWTRRDRLRGASTITQQLAKNLYLSPSRNPLRKLKEAAIAYRMEWALSKGRILELYLNVVELGPNLWGMEAASQHYFGRSASRLTIDQAALLVATLPHPLTSNPEYRPGRARRRQQLVLRRLRGEEVEVPRVETEDSMPPADTLKRPDSLDADTTRRDTTGQPHAPRPTPQSTRRSGITRQR